MNRDHLQKFVARFKQYVSLPTDSDDTKAKKTLFVVVSYGVAVASLIGGFTFLLSELYATAGVLFTFIVLTLLNLLIFYYTKQFFILSIVQQTLFLFVPFALYVTVWDLREGYTGFIMMWALLSPISALVAHGKRQASVWFLDYVLLLVAFTIFEPSVTGTRGYKFFLLQANVLIISGIIYFLFQYVVLRSEKVAQSYGVQHKLFSQEHAHSKQLINNLLPEGIVERLKTEPGMIADNFDEVTVLFADIVGFTELSSQVSPKELVDILNLLFSAFDMILEKYGMEKIKTMGDSYMAASGLPVERVDHADVAAQMAVEILDEVSRFSMMIGENINVRIGLNSGPVVAGVIGLKKSVYDLWGDTVNVASRMESTGIPGKIQVSEATYALLKDKYWFTSRGSIDVKGKGAMNTYILDRVKISA